MASCVRFKLPESVPYDITPVAVISVSKSICAPVGIGELTILEIAMIRSICMDKELELPALSVAERVMILSPPTRFTLCDQFDTEESGAALSVAVAIPPTSEILPVIIVVEPTTCAPSLCEYMESIGAVVSSIIDATVVVSTQASSVNVAWTVFVPSVGLNVTGMTTLPDDARVPVALSVIPLPERIYETGLATDISISVTEAFVYDPERK